MPEDDKKFDAALAGFFHRESRDNVARKLCPDPELLAAYHERALSPEESQAMQLHVTGCSRCQEVLAHLATSENLPLETAQRVGAESAGATPQTFPGQNVREITQDGVSAATLGSSRSHRQWRWIAPAGAIAASLLVWIAYRETRLAYQAPAAAVHVAENRKEKETDMPVAAPPPSRAATSQQVSPKLAQAPPAAQSANNLGRFDSLKARTRNETKTLERDASNISPDLQSGDMSAAIPAEDAAKLPYVTQEENKKMSASSRQPAAPQAPSVSAAAPAGAARETVEVSSALRSDAMAYRLAKNKSAVIVSPKPAIQWRVGAEGVIEYSSTAGRKWQQQVSGVTEELLSGFAPQKNVCWVVGRSGTILLTTDSGVTWHKIPSPTDNDLGVVHATDALHATIWELAGRKRFETADGGETWNPLAAQ